ncbi:MAG: flagellar M-ring protein FliF, partial [Rhodanobacter sp.]
GILAALLVAFGLLRPLLKGALRGEVTAKAKELPAPIHAINVHDDDEPSNEVKPALLSGSTPQLVYEQRIEAARKMVGEDSKQVAQVVKNWVNEDAA